MSSYDVIGLDVNKICSFDIFAMPELITAKLLIDLHENFDGYQSMKVIDMSFDDHRGKILKSWGHFTQFCVWDIETGMILTLGKDKRVLFGVRGW